MPASGAPGALRRRELSQRRTGESRPSTTRVFVAPYRIVWFARSQRPFKFWGRSLVLLGSLLGTQTAPIMTLPVCPPHNPYPPCARYMATPEDAPRLIRVVSVRCSFFVLRLLGGEDAPCLICISQRCSPSYCCYRVVRQGGEFAAT